jgi:hypothetical protein
MKNSTIICLVISAVILFLAISATISNLRDSADSPDFLSIAVFYIIGLCWGGVGIFIHWKRT